jgi:hypothetical protein
MTWSFDFGGVWDMLLGGKSDTLSVQVWPVGIEDCIAPPVEGEEWDLDMDSWGYSGKDSWLWLLCLMPVPLPWHLRDIQQGCITDGHESCYSFSPFSFSSASFCFFLFLDLRFPMVSCHGLTAASRVGPDRFGSDILYLICAIWYSLDPDLRF